MSENNNNQKKYSLYVVSLPIGNSEDITIRAKKILEESEIIAAEDTRKAKNWIGRVQIKTKARFIAYHSHNEENSAEGIMKLLLSKGSVCLVSDAGTPRISDPGYALIRKCYENEIPVISIPGASSLTSALSVSPLPVSPLLFLGFITPKEKKRLNFLEGFRDYDGTVVFFETVHRIQKLTGAIINAWGNLEVFIIREITKVNEEYFWGTLDDSLLWLDKKKGEFIIIVNKRKKNKMLIKNKVFADNNLK
ncbi:MAG: 16S rRNA (cytidine(1402)-2'-O)-methyltransferase [Spirochaetia bacterium]|nr:16S rRNA (cytidine(1402)-2'-O)-methyltransferase [Spirochaetia bacterium]